jgi:hypothetical protein
LQSKGGGNTWTNLVACCSACNSKKGDKSLEQLRWKLRQQPKVSKAGQHPLAGRCMPSPRPALPMNWSGTQ